MEGPLPAASPAMLNTQTPSSSETPNTTPSRSQSLRLNVLGKAVDDYMIWEKQPEDKFPWKPLWNMTLTEIIRKRAKDMDRPARSIMDALSDSAGLYHQIATTQGLAKQ